MIVKTKQTTVEPVSRRGRPSSDAIRIRKLHLLEVARGIFVRRGYRAATMDEVAIAAGITKRTLYAWHADKEALFRACVMLGAARFPKLSPNSGVDVATALEHYVIALHNELVREDSYGMGALFMREAGDFPELYGSIQRGYFDFLIEPLAAFLSENDLEVEGSVERSLVFVAMALMPLHNKMLVGLDLPDEEQAAEHARLCVGIFLGGSRIG